MSRADTIKYVDASISASGDGSSWTTAWKTLGEALAAARADEEAAATWTIRVAQGSYCPGTTQEATFLLDVDSLQIYGGYAGLQGGSTPDSRNIGTFETILSGLVPSTTPSVHAYHVVTIDDDIDDVDANGIPTTILDGATIKLGKANGSGLNASGGGIFSNEGEALIRNCTLENNTAASYGGGAYLHGSAAGDGDGMRLEACEFEENSAEANGGGLLLEKARADVVDCEFLSNTCTGTNQSLESANGGGGAWVAPGYGGGGQFDATFIGCTFRNNRAYAYAGGLGVADDGGLPPKLVNCQFYENKVQDSDVSPSQGAGGGLWSRRPIVLINATFVKNACYEENRGGGILFFHGDGVYTPGTLTNCILWHNKSNAAHNDEPDQIAVECPPGSGEGCEPNLPEVTYTCMQDLDTDAWQEQGDNNLDDDPEFSDINGFNLWMLGTGCNGSDCDSQSIDAGNNNSIGSEALDIGKRTRKVEREGHGVIIDFGCWETQTTE